MAKGGNRAHAKDCKCGNCPKMGRPKAERPVDGNLARKIKARVKAEELWVFLIAKAAEKAKQTGNTADLRNALEYLDNRDLGECTHHVNHMHDKPIEHQVTITISERMKLAMLKGEERVRQRA